MALNDISLTSSMRSNLISLQSTSALLSRTQDRLSSGKKVNSALDNPTNFFAAQGHTQRASDLSVRKDGMTEAVQGVQAANKGITAITALIESAKGLTQAARSADTANRNSLAEQFNTIMTQIDQMASDSGYKGKNFLTGDTLNVLFNENGSSALAINGFTGTSSGLSIATLGTATAAVEVSGLAAHSGAIITTGVTTGASGVLAAGAGTFYAAVSGFVAVGANTGGGTGVYDLTGLFNVAQYSGVNPTLVTAFISGVAMTGGAWHVSGSNTSGNIQLVVDNTYTGIQTGSSITFTYTVAAHYSGGTANAMTFDLYSSGVQLTTGQVSGKVLGVYVSGSYVPQSGLSGGYSIVGNQVIFTGVLGAGGMVPPPDAVTFSFVDPSKDVYKTVFSGSSLSGSEAITAVYVSGTLVTGGSYTASASGVITFTTGIPAVGQAVTYDTTVAAVAGDWDTDAGIDASVSGLNTAVEKLRTQSASLASNLSVVTIRQDFTDGMVNTLLKGADNLTLADMNEEGANMLMLQTRQQLGTTSLKMASDAAQSVLRLF